MVLQSQKQLTVEVVRSCTMKKSQRAGLDVTLAHLGGTIGVLVFLQCLVKKRSGSVKRAFLKVTGYRRVGVAYVKTF